MSPQRGEVKAGMKLPLPPRWLCMSMVLALVAWSAVDTSRARPDYARRFATEKLARVHPRSLEPLLNSQAYDRRFFEPPSRPLSNDEGDMAWQTCYRMAGLNEMYPATGQQKYLQLNMRWAEAVLAARDDKARRARWNGNVGPVWSSVAFGRYGRTAYLVHTAMITYPILELLHLKGISTAQDRRLLHEMLASLHAHDEQWRDGPHPGEGYYVYSREQDEALAGEPLPINRMSAIAKSLWMAWKLTGDADYRDRTLALARFFRHRLEISETGAYVWPYDIPVYEDAKSRPPEDSSHGALTASLVPLLHADGEVFTRIDLTRFAATVVHGVATRPDGLIGGDVAGSQSADPLWVDSPARWLEFAPYHRAIYPRIASYYARYDANTQPDTASLALALLIRYRPAPSGEERTAVHSL